jgi:predicted nucleotide-binding protein
MVNMLLGLPTSDFSLLEGKGKDVTRRFIQIPTEKRISLKLIKKGRIAPTKKVFIVHGHDYKPVKELRTMLTEFGLEPIVLHEQPSGGRTLVEKLEKYSDVGYAFVILTPDDGLFSLYKLREMIDRIEAMKIDKAQQNKMAWEGLLKSIRRVARQNVIFEFGYFMGLLGRNRVCCLHKGDVQRPSDMQGIVYVPFKDSVNEARNMIIKELREAGYEISGEIKKSRWVKVTLNKDDTVKIE